MLRLTSAYPRPGCPVVSPVPILPPTPGNARIRVVFSTPIFTPDREGEEPGSYCSVRSSWYPTDIRLSLSLSRLYHMQYKYKKVRVSFPSPASPMIEFVLFFFFVVFFFGF